MYIDDVSSKVPDLKLFEPKYNLDLTISKTSFAFRVAMSTLLGALAGGSAGFVVGGPAGIIAGLLVGAGIGLVAGIIFFGKYEDYCQDKIDAQKRHAEYQFFVKEYVQISKNILLYDAPFDFAMNDKMIFQFDHHRNYTEIT